MDGLPLMTSPLPTGLRGGAETFLHSREQDAHQQMEAVFLSMLVKELRTAGLDEGLFPGDESDTFGGMFDSFLSDELAKAGGLGLQQLLQAAADPSTDDFANTHQQAVEAYQHVSTH